MALLRFGSPWQVDRQAACSVWPRADRLQDMLGGAVPGAQYNPGTPLGTAPFLLCALRPPADLRLRASASEDRLFAG